MIGSLTLSHKRQKVILNRLIEQSLFWFMSSIGSFRNLTFRLSYFANRFGFEVLGQIEVKPGIPPTPKHRDEIILLMKEAGVKTILTELFYDRTPSEYVSKRTGAKIVQVPIDVGAIPEAKDYFALITYILDQLIK